MVVVYKGIHIIIIAVHFSSGFCTGALQIEQIVLFFWIDLQQGQQTMRVILITTYSSVPNGNYLL